MGRSSGFRPVGSAAPRGVVPRIQADSSRDRTTTGGTGFHMRESDFPSLVPAGPPTNRLRTKTLYTVSGIPFLFDPSVPPPQIPRIRPLFPPPTTRQPIHYLRPTSTTHRPIPVIHNRQAPRPHPTVSHPNPPNNLHTLTTTIFRFLQLSHHRRNWNTLPTSLNHRLNSLLLDINPPLVNDTLRGALTDKTNTYRQEVATEVVKHLDYQLLLIQNKLKELKPEGLEEAAHSAESQLRQRLQKRYNKRNCIQDLQTVRHLIKTKSIKSIKPVNSNIISVTINHSPVASSSNQTQAPVIESSSMEGVQPLLLPPPATPQIPTKICLQNRFQILSALEDSPRKRRLSSDPEEESSSTPPP